MNNVIKITASDGKIFEGNISNYAEVVTRLTKYEEELRIKKEKAEAEAKLDKEKADKITEIRQTKLKEIQDDMNKLNNKIHKYEKETGYKLIYHFDNSITAVKDTINPLSYSYDELIKNIMYNMRTK